MRASSLFALLTLVILATGCRTTRPLSGDVSPPPGPGGGGAGEADTTTKARGDVTVDGVSILGAWHAVEVIGNAQATRDLEEGRMEQTLIVSSNGRAVLTGVDRREGEGPVAFNGRITGSRVQFAGMEGSGTLIMSGRRLVLSDPTGRRTVFVRGGG